MTTRPRVAQLHPSGATNGQVPIWDAAAGVWIVGDQTGGSVPCRATLVATGGETVLYLGAVPVSSSEQIYVNGLLKVWGGVDYTLTLTAAVFTVALAASDRVVVTYDTAGACGIASLAKKPVGYTRPVPLSRPVRRFHRIR